MWFVEKHSMKIRPRTYPISAVAIPLAILLLFVLMASQNASAEQDGDYTYSINGDAATITEYTGPGGAIAIPYTLGGHTTKAIHDVAFWENDNVTSVMIPNSVTSIGLGAFSYCTALTQVNLGNGITNVEWGAFHGCRALTTVVMGDGVTSIGVGMFQSCTSLRSVIIGDGVTSIGSWAFHDCASMTSAIIGRSVAYIGEGAFQSCPSLTSIAFLGPLAPSVGPDWMQGANAGMRGHAFAASAFPVQGSLWNGLLMGSTLPIIPSAPTGLVAVAGDSQISLEWVAPFDETNIDYYVVYQDGNALPGHVNATMAIINGLANGQIFYFTIAAHSPAGLGCQSSGVLSIPFTTPDAPMDIRAISGNAKIALQWRPPAFNGGRAVDHYVIIVDGNALSGSIMGLAIEINGLNNAQIYNLTVAAHNSAGTGMLSASISAMPFTVPGVPVGLAATPGAGKVSLAWQAPSSNGGSPITLYVVYRGGQVIANLSASSLTYDDTSGSAGTIYAYTVAASNAAGLSGESMQISASPQADNTFLYAGIAIAIIAVIAVVAVVMRRKK